MAFQTSFTTSHGFLADKSYWFPAVIARDKARKICQIDFIGFKDKKAKDDAMASIKPTGLAVQPIGTKRYIATGKNYDDFFADEVFESGETDLSKQAYLFALSALEGTPPIPGQKDDRKSFFDSAKSV